MNIIPKKFSFLIKDIISRTIAFLRTINLISLKFLFKPSKIKMLVGETNKIYRLINLKTIKTITLQEVIKNYTIDDKIFNPVKYIKQGSSPLQDLITLGVLVNARKPKHIFEIGTFEGLSSVIFSENSGEDSKIYTLDLPGEESNLPRTERSFAAQSVNCDYDSGYLIDSYNQNNKIVRLFGDSALFDFDPYKGKVDFFFIDGSHAYDYVLKDTLTAFNCISDNGWVLWHDCFVPGIFNVLKKIIKYQPVFIIDNTNIAYTTGKPSQALVSKLRKE